MAGEERKSIEAIATNIDMLSKNLREMAKKSESQHKDLSIEMKACTNAITELDKRFSLQDQAVRHELEKINNLDEQQNSILDEHIAGVNTLREMLELQREEFELLLKQRDERIDKLEVPQKALVLMVKVVGGVGVISSSIFGVLKLFGAV